MHCRRFSPVRSRQRGAALVVAMLVFALCAAMVVAMQGEFLRFFQRSSNVLLAEQVHAYLRGAEDIAALVLQADFDQDKNTKPPQDNFSEFWAQQPQPYPVDDGGLLLAEPLVDLQGRFNLNLLAAKPPSGATGAARFTTAQQQFIRLLQALDFVESDVGDDAVEGAEVSQFEAEAITAAVSDWLDADSNVSSQGAEDDHYGGITPSYRTANRPMGSVSELRAVANMTPEIYSVLAPNVTVWPEIPDKLNIHTATLPVLRSINAKNNLNPLSLADGESLKEIQAETGFTDLNDFYAQAVFQGKDLGDLKSMVGQKSSYFILHAWVELADRNTHLYSVLERKNRRVRVIVRASGSL